MRQTVQEGEKEREIRERERERDSKKEEKRNNREKDSEKERGRERFRLTSSPRHPGEPCGCLQQLLSSPMWPYQCEYGSGDGHENNVAIIMRM